jgi:hypothetical protein
MISHFSQLILRPAGQYEPDRRPQFEPRVRPVPGQHSRTMPPLWSLGRQSLPDFRTLLGTHRKRPGGDRTTDKTEKLSSPHVRPRAQDQAS